MDNSRLLDAKIAVEKFCWQWEERGSRKFLLPPDNDERRLWTAMWDENGIPHYLPRYSTYKSSTFKIEE